jgi:hypothetical protein
VGIYGNGIARVSDVLDAWGDPGQAEGLTNWAAGLGYSWQNVRQHAADVGTHTHSIIETMLRGVGAQSYDDAYAIARKTVEVSQAIPASMHDEVGRACHAFGQWCEGKVIEPEHLEETIVDHARRFGGTCDFKGKINGARCLLDWKTSKRTYRRHKVQLAAYAILHDLEHPDEPIEFYGTVRLDKRLGVAEDHYWRNLDAERAFFLTLLNVHDLGKAIQL